MPVIPVIATPESLIVAALRVAEIGLGRRPVGGRCRSGSSLTGGFLPALARLSYDAVWIDSAAAPSRGNVNMTKLQLAGTSLVAAVPAGFMTYFGIMAFLNHADTMGGMLQVVTGTTLLTTVLMTLSPVAVMIFVRSPDSGDDDAATAGSAASAAAAPAAAASVAEMDAVDADEEAAEFEPADEAEEIDSGEIAAADSEEFSFEEASEEGSGGDDSFEFEDDAFEFEDDEK
jgi:hypothetical protein